MKICYDQGDNDIRVSHTNELTSFSMPMLRSFTGNCSCKSFTRAFFSISRLDVSEFQAISLRALSRYFGMNSLCLRNNLHVRPL